MNNHNWKARRLQNELKCPAANSKTQSKSELVQGLKISFHSSSACNKAQHFKQKEGWMSLKEPDWPTYSVLKKSSRCQHWNWCLDTCKHIHCGLCQSCCVVLLISLNNFYLTITYFLEMHQIFISSMSP